MRLCRIKPHRSRDRPLIGPHDDANSIESVAEPSRQLLAGGKRGGHEVMIGVLCKNVKREPRREIGALIMNAVESRALGCGSAPGRSRP